MNKIGLILLFFSSLSSMEQIYLLRKQTKQYGTIEKNIVKQKSCWENEKCWEEYDRKVVFPTAAACGSGFYSWIGTMAMFTLCGADISAVWHLGCLVSCVTCSTVGGWAVNKNWRKRDLEIEKK